MMNGSPPKTLELVVPIASGKPSNDVGIGGSNSTDVKRQLFWLEQPNIPALSAGEQHSSPRFES